jgi:hypothetical protein
MVLLADQRERSHGPVSGRTSPRTWLLLAELEDAAGCSAEATKLHRRLVALRPLALPHRRPRRSSFTPLGRRLLSSAFISRLDSKSASVAMSRRSCFSGGALLAVGGKNMIYHRAGSAAGADQAARSAAAFSRRGGAHAVIIAS